jgi:hypothetical protein
MKFTIEIDCEPAADVLHDYFDIVLPEEYLVNVIKNSGILIGELVDGSIRDTAARDYLIDAVVRSLPDSKGKDWPTYGTSKAIADSFYAWFAAAIVGVGGTFDTGA